MPKLAIVRQKYTASGGAERFVSRAINALQQQNEVDIYLISRHWEKIKDLQLITANPFYLGNVWRDAGFARAAKHLWQKNNIDLVQSHERISGCHIYRAGDGVHAHWLNLRRQSLSLFSRLALRLNPYHYYVCRAEKRMFLHKDLRKIICNSQMIKREIQDYFHLPEHLFSVIYNGVDGEAFHPKLASEHREDMRKKWKISQTTPLLLYVGSGFARKGLDRALHAIAAFDDVELMVVGKDKRQKHYQKLAKRLGLINRVHFAQTQNDVKPFYAMADAFILPTLYDPFPNVCIEALACGLPVFTSSNCGSAELLQNAKNGWVCDVFDLAAWQKNIAAWLALREIWSELRNQARDTIKDLTLPNMAEQLLSLYRDLLKMNS